jgi:hypothetical protein
MHSFRITCISCEKKHGPWWGSEYIVTINFHNLTCFPWWGFKPQSSANDSCNLFYYQGLHRHKNWSESFRTSVYKWFYFHSSYIEFSTITYLQFKINKWYQQQNTQIHYFIACSVLTNDNVHAFSSLTFFTNLLHLTAKWWLKTGILIQHAIDFSSFKIIQLRYS